MTTSPSPTPVRPPVPGPLQETAPTFIGMPKFPKGAREALANTQQRRNLHHATHTIRGKRVVVIGGGDTAMDCVRTAVRQGAASVTCLYRRDRANMPGSLNEVRHAEEEGVRFEWLSAPAAIEGEAGRVARVQAQRVRLGAPDASGRRAPEADPGSEFALDADLVILALGFDPEDLPAMFGAPDLSVTRWGTLRVDHKTMMTSLDGVFAAGDVTDHHRHGSVGQRVAVVPVAAHPVAGLEHRHLVPRTAQLPCRREPGDPSPDDEDVEDDSARHGQALVERMLGATVIPETPGQWRNTAEAERTRRRDDRLHLVLREDRAAVELQILAHLVAAGMDP